MVQDRCKSNTSKMSGASNLMLRASIVLGMVAAVVTVIYFTPMPGKTKKKSFGTWQLKIIFYFIL